MRYFIALLGLGLILGACRGNGAKERVAAEREAWEASLPDSIKAITRETDSIRDEIRTLTGQAEDMLQNFDYVDNPSEVEGYYIAKAWKSSYPLTATGLVARLNKGEQLELIAALGGGAHFDRLRVEADGKTAETSTVPFDQALNYRLANLNIVCFSDSAANSCARLIAEHDADGIINIIYLNGGKQTGSYKYPVAARNVMTDTWNLYDTRSRLQHDERMLPLLARKSELINQKIDEIADRNKK